jgi:hypothetical protein
LSAPAQRFFAYKVPDGVVPEAWFPTGGTETNFELGAILQPLAAHKGDMLLMKGVHNLVADNTPGANGHAEGVSSLLSGKMAIDKGGNEWAGSGISIDQVIASDFEQRGIVSKKKSLELGPTAGGGYGTIAFAGSEQPLPGYNDPVSLFAMLFDNPGATAAEIAKRQARRKSILDGVSGDFAALAPKVSGEDQKRINAHLEALRDLEKRLFVPNACAASGYTVPTTFADNGERRRTFLDLTVLALSCDVTRVVTMTYDHSGGGGPTFPWLGVDDDVHELSHQIVGEAAGGPSKTKMTTVLAWFASQTAYFVDKLKAISTPTGGTLFDDTVVFQGSEISFNHGHSDMPFLILAGNKTPFRTGRYVTAPGVSHCNLLVTMLNAFGVNATTFGDANYCTGNLNTALTSL